jgi:hypothetical protein
MDQRWQGFCNSYIKQSKFSGMKKFLPLIVFLGFGLMVPVRLASPEKLVQLPLEKQPAFRAGEKLEYRIHYGPVNAGKASLEITEGQKINGKPTFNMIGLGWTTGMTDWFFRVRDRYETRVYKDNLLPAKFLRDVDEGGYIIKQYVDFDRLANTATDTYPKPAKRFQVPQDVHDMMSAFYFARSLQTENLNPGDHIPIKIFLDNEVFETRLKFVKREVVHSDIGKIPCLVMVPLLQTDRVFREKEGMTIYVSADKNKIPIRIQTDLRVGSIRVDITQYKNLKYPLAIVK